MKTFLAGSLAVIAIAVAVPFASAEGPRHGPDGPRGPGAHGPKFHDRHGGGHHEMRRHRRGKHFEKGAKMRLMDLIETYDANADGAVSQAEVDQFRADRLKKFDADGDGKLSLAEYEKLWLDAMRERMVDAFQRHDDDGDGQVTTEEFGERTKRMVMMRDRNDDGVLNMDDTKRRRHGLRTGKPSKEN